MNTYAPLFSQVVDSSLWREPYFVRIVFLTLLAKKDSDHVVRGSAYNISHWANVPEAEVIEALKILSSPDTRRIEKQEFDGRRIQKVEDGWLVLNGAKYQALARKVAERARKAKWAREHRGKIQRNVPSLAEQNYEKNLNGEPQ